MGRPERTINPDADVVQQFAGALRDLRDRAGRLTYRQLASRTGYSVTALSEAAGGRQFPSLPVTLAYAGACAGDREEWEFRWRGVERILAERARSRLLCDEPPYLGLAGYQPDDAQRYFGREGLVAELTGRVLEQPFLAVIGPSGCGKSSLLRAGLLASADTDAMPGAWLTVVCPLGQQPARELAAALADPLEVEPGATPVGAAIGKALDGRPGTRLLVVLDQFEEIFTVCPDHAERVRFIRILRQLAADPDDRIRVVLGIRADFYAHCAEYPELAEILRDAALFVGPMTAAELTRAVTKPAHRAGLKVDRALLNALLRDAASQPGALPLVSHVLLETWLHRRGDTLTLAGYEAAGGVHGALARTAEQVYAGLPVPHRVTARRVLMRMVALGDGVADTRRWVFWSELDGDDADEVGPVVERLVQARLLTRDRDTVQLAHEALIWAWPRLRGWLREDRAGLRTHRQLTQAAHAWQSLDRPASGLYRGSRLAVAREWAGENGRRVGLTPVERGFLDASVTVARAEQSAAARRARLLRVLAGALAALSLLAGTVGVVTVRQGQAGLSRELAARSRAQAGVDPDAAMRLALRAYRTAQTVPARGALLSVASHPIVHARLTEHQGPVTAVAFTPDTRVLASAGQDRVVVVWDVASGSRLHVLAAEPVAIRALAITDDGLTVAAVREDGGVVRWDLRHGSPMRPLSGPPGTTGLAFSPDGRLLALAGADRSIIVWNLREGTSAARLGRHGGSATRVTFSPDGRIVAIASDDGTVTLWDPRTGVVRRLTASTRTILVMAFSPDGRRLAVAGRDQPISVWEVSASPRAAATLRGHADAVRGLAYSPDGRLLISAGDDRRATLWDTASGRPITTLTGLASALHSVAVSPDSRFIASGSADGSVLLWDRSRLPLLGHTDRISDLAFSHDGTFLATGGDDHTVRLWHADSHRPRGILTPGAAAPPLTAPGLGRVAPDPAAVAFPPRRAVALSPDDRILATGGEPVIRLWDTASGTPLGTLPGHREAVAAVAFSPDGRLLASAGGADRTVRLWDLGSTGAGPSSAIGQRSAQHLLTESGADVRAVAFSPDGRLLASGGLDQAVTLWDTGRRDKIATLFAARDVEDLAISPDGRLIAVGTTNGDITLWDISGRRAITTLVGHRARVLSLAFSPDGRLLASGGLDHDIILWDLTEQTRWATLSGHTDLVLGLAFSPDSTTLASASGDRTVIMWTVDPERAGARMPGG